MFFVDSPSCFDPEQLNLNDRNIEFESADDGPPPLLNREAIGYDTDPDSEDDEEGLDWESKNNEARNQVDLSPLTLAQAGKVLDIEGRFIYKTLFDSGATGACLNPTEL